MNYTRLVEELKLLCKEQYKHKQSKKDTIHRRYKGAHAAVGSDKHDSWRYNPNNKLAESEEKNDLSDEDPKAKKEKDIVVINPIYQIQPGNSKVPIDNKT